MASGVINDTKSTHEVNMSEAKAGDHITFIRKDGEKGASGHIATIISRIDILGITIGFNVLEGHLSDKINERFIPSVVLSKNKITGWGNGITDSIYEFSSGQEGGSTLEFHSIRRWNDKDAPKKHR